MTVGKHMNNVLAVEWSDILSLYTLITFIRIDMDFNSLNFTIFCVNNVATYLNRNAREVYHLMQDANIINGYIVPCYDVLHTFSKEYIVEDLVSFMRKKGVLS